MRQPLNVLPSPCTSCPYRRDTPSGVWDASEYEKLKKYDDNGSFAVFLCHQSREIGAPTVCRGWLSVHAESAAARLAVVKGDVTNEQRYAAVREPLYATGNEAADAGLRGVRRPGKKARAVVARLIRRVSGGRLEAVRTGEGPTT